MESYEDLRMNQFKYPILEEELGEFQRVSGSLHVPVSDLLYAAEKGEMIQLDEQLWSELQNSDSYDIQKGDWETVERLSNEVNRDWKTLKEEIGSGKAVNAPIIVKHQNKYHKVSGNTRLMVCRALGIVPKVLVFEVG
jgi:hypothetical protein